MNIKALYLNKLIYFKKIMKFFNKKAIINVAVAILLGQASVQGLNI